MKENQPQKNDEIQPSLELISSWKSEFDLGYLLVQSFDASPISFRTSAYMSLLFSRLDKKDALERLTDWLVDHIAPFHLHSPRDETDLEDKTLGIAAYIMAADCLEIEALPSDLLIDYIEYAEKQHWFNDTFLAFFCNFLRGQVQACEKIEDYFLANIEQFLARKNVAAICQSLIVLSKRLSNQDCDKATNLLVSLIPQDLSQPPSTDLFWAFWALSIVNRTSDQRFITSLDKEICLRLRENLAYLVKTFKPIGLFALARSDTTEEALEEYLKDFGTEFQYEYNSANGKFTVYLKDSPGREGNKDQKARKNYLDIGSLTFGILSMFMARRYSITGVSGSAEEILSSALEWNRQKSKGAILITKSSVIIGNYLALFLTVVIGISYILYTLGYGFQIIAPQNVQRPGLGDVFLIVSWLDFLFSQIHSIKRGGSAIDGMRAVPVLRHFIKLLKR